MPSTPGNQLCSAAEEASELIDCRKGAVLLPFVPGHALVTTSRDPCMLEFALGLRAFA